MIPSWYVTWYRLTQPAILLFIFQCQRCYPWALLSIGSPCELWVVRFWLKWGYLFRLLGMCDSREVNDQSEIQEFHGQSSRIRTLLVCNLGEDWTVLHILGSCFQLCFRWLTRGSAEIATLPQILVANSRTESLSEGTPRSTRTCWALTNQEAPNINVKVLFVRTSSLRRQWSDDQSGHNKLRAHLLDVQPKS